MSAREAAILDALQQRLSDVRDRIVGLTPEVFGDAADYLKRLQQSLSTNDRPDNDARVPAGSDGKDCVKALCAISLTSGPLHPIIPSTDSAQFFELLKVQDAHNRKNCRHENDTEPWACTDCDCTRRLEQRLAETGEPFLKTLESQ